MATLRNAASNRLVFVEAEFVVGRSPRSGLSIVEAYVSHQHATLRWTGQAWELKDLGSRNGTFVDQRRLEPGGQQIVRAGARLAFGHLGQEWVLEDDAPPSVMLVPLGEGENVLAEGGLLVVPSAEEPQAAIYRGADGQWLIERDDEPTGPILDQALVQVAGRVWRFCCPNTVAPTSLVSGDLEVQKLALRFAVSRDEEHVELKVKTSSLTIDLGSRTHHYLLLTLARMRLKDAATGLPSTAAGWMYQDDLVEQLHTSPAQLNVEVFRIRQQFASLNLRDAATIIERRPRARQLRIGVQELEISVL